MPRGTTAIGGARASRCAILTGIGTVRQDGGPAAHRAFGRDVAAARAGSSSTGAVDAAGSCVLRARAMVRSSSRPGRATRYGHQAVEVLALPDADGRVDLVALMQALGAREINELHVEAGGRLERRTAGGGRRRRAGALPGACPAGRPGAGASPVSGRHRRLSERIGLAIQDVKSFGDDSRVPRAPAQRGVLMFTGMVQAMGRVTAATASGDGLRVAIDMAAIGSTVSASATARRQPLLPDGRPRRRASPSSTSRRDALLRDGRSIARAT